MVCDLSIGVSCILLVYVVIDFENFSNLNFRAIFPYFFEILVVKMSIFNMAVL